MAQVRRRIGGFSGASANSGRPRRNAGPKPASFVGVIVAAATIWFAVDRFLKKNDPASFVGGPGGAADDDKSAAGVTDALRKMWLTTDWSKKAPQSGSKCAAVVADLATRDGWATVAVSQDGSVSLFYSRGGARIGAGGNASVASRARDALGAVPDVGGWPAATDTEYPRAGEDALHVVTAAGRRRATGSELSGNGAELLQAMRRVRAAIETQFPPK